jgi:hypothetical protein
MQRSTYLQNSNFFRQYSLEVRRCQPAVATTYSDDKRTTYCWQSVAAKTYSCDKLRCPTAHLQHRTAQPFSSPLSTVAPERHAASVFACDVDAVFSLNHSNPICDWRCGTTVPCNKTRQTAPDLAPRRRRSTAGRSASRMRRTRVAWCPQQVGVASDSGRPIVDHWTKRVGTELCRPSEMGGATSATNDIAKTSSC